MSSAVTRFEVILPWFDNLNFPNSYNAGQDFINGMTSLVESGTAYKHLYLIQGYDYVTQESTNIIMGFLTTGQQSTALSLLATLNANIDVSYQPLICIAWSAVSEP